MQQILYEQIKQTKPENFEENALRLFQYQAENNPIYKIFIQYLGINPGKIQSIKKIPFLPIDFFKTQKIITENPTKNPQENTKIEAVFESSGTTLSQTSKHYVMNLNMYLDNATHIFENFYGKLEDFFIFALLPSYLERQNSSLVAMVSHFLGKSEGSSPINSPKIGGFYLDDYTTLLEKIQFAKKIKKPHQKILLIGVTFALLDVAERFSVDLSDVIIMETGGMKGKRREMLREEVHFILKNVFNTTEIHSEYGMTELLSQGYARGGDVFEVPFSCKVLLRDISDPFDLSPTRRQGAINVIDLANVDSCAFIATQDVGEIIDEYAFKVLGRMDNSDVRGCNLLYER